MLDLENQLRVLARSTVDPVAPVTADEARQRQRRGRGGVDPRRVWSLAIAAMLLVVVGVFAVVNDGSDDDDDVVASVDGYPLDLDGHRDWMIAVLNGDVDADDDAFTARFDEPFRDAVTIAQLQELVASLRFGAPWSASTEVQRTGDVLATQLLGAGGTKARFTVSLDDDRRAAAMTVLVAQDCPGLTPVDPTVLDGDSALAWAYQLVNDTRRPDDAELADRLSPDFLAQVPPDEFRRRLSEIHAIGPFTPRYYETAPTATGWLLRVGTSYGEEARLVVDVDGNGDIDVLNLTTQPPCALP